MILCHILFAIILGVALSNPSDRLLEKDLNQQTNTYRFSFNATLPEPFAIIKTIEPISNDSILIYGQPSNQSPQFSVKVFTGPAFNTKTQQITYPNEPDIKFSTNKIYINKGDSISQQLARRINFSGNVKSFSDSRSTIVGRWAYYHNFTRYPETKTCITLYRMNLDTLQIQPIPNDKLTGCQMTSHYYGGVIALKNNRIAQYDYQNVYIVNTQTLNIQQVIQSELIQKGKTKQLNRIDFQYDPQENKSVLLLGGTLCSYLETLVYSHQTGKFEHTGIFDSPRSFNFRMVGTDEGYSFVNPSLVHYRKIHDFILLIDNNQSATDQLLINRIYLSLTQDESLFVMWDQTDQKVQAYSLNEKSSSFQTKKMFQFDNIEGSLISSALTSDDKKFFIMTEANGKRSITVCDFADRKTYPIVEAASYTHLDFIVLNADLDRFVILVKKASTSQQNVTYTHHLQIRKLSSFNKVEKQFPLPFLDNTVIFGYRLLTHSSWGHNLLILIKTQSQYSLADRSVSYLCTVENDQLQSIVQNITQLSFYLTFPSQKYIITTPFNQQSIKIYNKQTLELVDQIQGMKLPKFNSNYPRIVYQKDVLLIEQIAKVTIFDFSGNSKQWFAGQMNYPSEFYYYPMKRILFPVKKLFVFYLFDYNQNLPVKIVLNATFPIDKFIEIPQISQSILYGEYVPKRNNRQSDLFACIQGNYLKIFKNQQPYAKPSSYQLQRDDDPSINLTQIWTSSDNRHLIVLMSFSGTFKTRIELRAIDNDFRVEWEKQYTYPFIPGWADYTEEGYFMNNLGNSLDILSLTKTNPAEEYGLKSIRYFNSNDNGMLKKPPCHCRQNRGLTLDVNGSKVAFAYETTTEKITVLAWKLSSPYERINEGEYTGSDLRTIHFAGQQKLFLDVDGKTYLVQLLSTQIFEQTPSQFPASQIYKISKDGTVFAFVTNTSSITIYDQQGRNISYIELQSQTPITTLNFANDNSLYAIDNNSVVYSFISQSCPHGYTNQNSHCLCLREHASKQNDCQCDKNFKDQEDGLCVCQQPFVLSGSSCLCRDNQVQVGDGCECHQNFVKNNYECMCEEPFVLNGKNCSCRQNQVQVGNGCECHANFVKTGSECMCEEPFVLEGERCQCKANSTQKSSQCPCNYNFVEIQGSCLCPIGFNFNEGKCLCELGKFVFQNQCNECSFWCSQCNGSGLSCSSFSIGLYLIVIGGSFFIIGLSIGGFLLMRKIIKKGQIQKLQEKNHTEQDTVKDILSEQTLKKPLRDEE